MCPDDMSDTTTTFIDRVLHRLREKVRETARAIGNAHFQADDAFARQHGWTIEASGGGLRGRTYRDPRFDQLLECARCAGSGRIGGSQGPCGNGGLGPEEPCSRCRGTGRIRLHPAMDLR